MSTSDQEQKTGAVPQHKRMAMGAPITGTTGKTSGQGTPQKFAQGGSVAKKK
jgi:hypothetical protein